jgi:hypothetical protein
MRGGPIEVPIRWENLEMKRTIVLSALALLLSLGGCAQILDIPDTVACGADDACTSDEEPCVRGECVDGTCAFTLVAQGEVVAGLEAGDCRHLVCDGEGNAVIAPDPADAPPDPTAGDCVAPTCSEMGDVIDAPAEDVPPDEIVGDCLRPACDAGLVSDAPDPNDVPSDDVAGDCSSPTCSDTGVTYAPNDDDLPVDDIPADCSSPTCQAGMVVVEPNPADTPPDITGDVSPPSAAPKACSPTTPTSRRPTVAAAQTVSSSHGPRSGCLATPAIPANSTSPTRRVSAAFGLASTTKRSARESSSLFRNRAVRAPPGSMTTAMGRSMNPAPAAPASLA